MIINDCMRVRRQGDVIFIALLIVLKYSRLQHLHSPRPKLALSIALRQ